MISQREIGALPEEEHDIEQVWQDTKGLIPSSGRAWFTPRMNRSVARLKRAVRLQDELSAIGHRIGHPVCDLRARFV